VSFSVVLDTWKLSIVAFVGALTLPLVLHSQPAEAGTWYYLPNPTNGYRVYLSPAYHAGGNTGCSGYVEDSDSEGAPDIAREAASGYGTDLFNRGYYVKVRSGISAGAKVSDSDGWGADIHIPIHSNAKTSSCGAGASYGGTFAIWQYSHQQPLATKLRDTVGPSSPGTGDKICSVPNCTQYTTLAELSTNAEEAYLELDYHTYNLGVNWLRDRTWQWRIGLAVDQYLGYP
jgi:hypothetical protein